MSYTDVEVAQAFLPIMETTLSGVHPEYLMDVWGMLTKNPGLIAYGKLERPLWPDTANFPKQSQREDSRRKMQAANVLE